MWRKYLSEPLPAMEPKVESFERTLAFVASKERPVLFVLDYLKTGAPATMDWLLHALHRMEVDSAAASVTVSRGKARLAIKLLATEPLEFSQFAGFPVKPEERAAGSPDQWHLTARTKNGAPEVKFLAALVPYRDGEKAPEITAITAPGAAGLQIGGTRIAAWWGSGQKGAIRLEELSGDGRLVIHAKNIKKEETIVGR